MTILIETENLQMREFTLEDVDAVYALCSSEQVTRYTGDGGIVNSRDDALQVIKNVWLKEYKENGYARYAIVEKESSRVIGFCGFKFNKDFQAPDIGYQLMPEFWGKGFGTEAVRASMEYAKSTLKFPQVFAEVAKDNTASKKILSKLGFEYVKTYDKKGLENHLYKYEFAKS